MYIAMSYSIYQLINDAIDELKVRLKEENHDHISDLIHEVADSRVLIYNNQLLATASSDYSLICEEPEF